MNQILPSLRRRIRAALRLSLAACIVSTQLIPRDSSAGFFPDDPFSDKAAGTTGANFLKNPAGARADGLGGTYVAVADSAESVFWNPAGLAWMEEQGFSETVFSYYSLLETSYSGSGAYAMPLPGSRGVLAAAFLYASQDSIHGFDSVGNPSRSFRPNDLSFSVAYGKKLRSFHAGGAIKVIRSQIDDASGTTFAADVGIQAERVTDVGDGALDLGLSIRNIGPPIKLGSEGDPLPFKAQMGAMWHISPRVTGAADIHIPADQDFFVSFGLEGHHSFGETVTGFLRAGYNVANERGIDGLSGMAAGAGLDVARIRFDYAWVPLGDLGTTHRLTFGARF